ncbi:succinate dehydrogenase, cytochrome b556 subunit [Parvularcula lutaonensis]|uniref:Succinate dehydrogenase cytochrome b556 subunit n=1 Tax=Parvularcula lutaonensis TaxID=491923 RepID=A0ABV7M8V1_9PROT|nr:succinate dehydrogenase, cytochrome b556 subunit [Parvularcula lutaonensis]GGY45771.1 succinate dehydrogenase, cytochrome b556 subunit [Parvularcula lutaonensis]
MSESAHQVKFIPGRNAPMSPHLQVWKFTVTMAASITHRATGIANAIGMLLLTAWIASAAISEDAFDAVMGFLGSTLGLILLVGFTWSIMFHLVNGLRYLAMDSGKAISKEAGNLTATLAFVASVILTGLIFWAGFTFGGAN